MRGYVRQKRGPACDHSLDGRQWLHLRLGAADDGVGLCNLEPRFFRRKQSQEPVLRGNRRNFVARASGPDKLELALPSRPSSKVQKLGLPLPFLPLATDRDQRFTCIRPKPLL